MRLRPVAILALAAASALCACGSASKTPEEALRDEATAVLESKDAEEFCAALVTDRFVDEVFRGSRANCVRAQKEEDEEEGTPKVGKVTVAKGGRAGHVAVAVKGGDQDGLAGHLGFAKEEDAWKLDSFESDFIRNSMSIAISSVDQGALSYEPMRRCMATSIGSLGDRQIRGFVYGSLNKDPRVQKALIEVAETCPAELSEYIAREIASSLAQNHHDDIPQAFVTCLKREFAAVLQLAGLTGALLGEEVEPSAESAAKGAILAAEEACEGKL